MTSDDLQQPELAPEAARTLRLLLQAHGFDPGRPIHVRELPERRGFHLTQ
jgi:hypothetical protein